MLLWMIKYCTLLAEPIFSLCLILLNIARAKLKIVRNIHNKFQKIQYAVSK